MVLINSTSKDSFRATCPILGTQQILWPSGSYLNVAVLGCLLCIVNTRALPISDFRTVLQPYIRSSKPCVRGV